MFKALCSGSITLHLIDEENLAEVICFVSNIASKKIIEKTIGFEFEDEYLYAILRQDCLLHYDETQIKLI